MDVALELGLELPGVVESTHYGAPALKLAGHMLACTPVNKSAEPNSLVLAIDLEQRTALLRAHPTQFYITDHYAPHPVVLIRLSKINRVELRRTLRLGWEFVSSGLAGAGAKRRPRRAI
jgi:hypothetical protein